MSTSFAIQDYRENLEFSSVPVGAWPARPFSLVSLLEMLSFSAEVFYLYSVELHTVIDGVMHKVDTRGQGALIVPEDLTEVQIVVEHLYPECKALDLKRTLERLDTVRLLLPRLVEHGYVLSDLQHELNEVDWSRYAPPRAHQSPPD
ncbi:MAG TPA: hypothetical protein VGJ55_19480 [Pyrinomonadaceae bacterium]